MIVYPAMDLLGGRVVRLRQGRFEDATVYSKDPRETLRWFASGGANWAHVVDLDGARVGTPVQSQLIAGLAGSSPINLQVAGGFRERAHLERMFGAGAARVVVGSLAVKDPGRTRRWLQEFGPERIVLSLDVRVTDGVPLVAVSGWSEDSGRTLWDVAAAYPDARHVLLTDIGRDGMLEGPNFALYEEAATRLPSVRIQASGGVSSLADLQRLKSDGAIVGKALWQREFSLEAALGLARA